MGTDADGIPGQIQMVSQDRWRHTDGIYIPGQMGTDTDGIPGQTEVPGPC